MQKADIACAAVLFGFGALVLVDSVRLDIGWGMEGPRPGFFPFLMSLGVLVCCVVVIVRAALRRGVAKSDKAFMPRQAIAPVLKTLLPIVGMVVLTELVGLYLAAGIYLAFSMRYIGRHGWPVVVAISVLLPGSLYYLFDKVFLIPMPAGSLRGLLGF